MSFVLSRIYVVLNPARLENIDSRSPFVKMLLSNDNPGPDFKAKVLKIGAG